jgi:hypothetical protein
MVFRDAVNWGGPWQGFVPTATELLGMRTGGADINAMTDLLYQRYEVKARWNEGDFAEWREIVEFILARFDRELPTLQVT